MKFFFAILTTSLLLFNVSSYGGGPAPCVGSTNTSCASALALTAGAVCANGTTCSGGAQVASTCLYAGSECSWYSFVATAASMIVTIDVGATGGCHISSNVYSSTGPCAGLTEISCQSGAPLDDVFTFTTLVPLATYYIQVCYSPGGPCGGAGTTGYADYCVSVDEPDPLCNTCAIPCGTASGFSSAPTVQQVVDSCDTSPFVPALAAGSVNTFCYSFQAIATSVDFNVIITSNCGGGNVSAFSWSLYNSTCGGAIQTGDLTDLNFSPLVVGNDYVFCYTFTVPGGCSHTQHCPYFVGAIVLPVSLLSFDGIYNGESVDLNWITASETNNDYFTLERSPDGVNFNDVIIVDGAGNSSSNIFYDAIDQRPYNGLTYYRLKQTDFDGSITYSKIISIETRSQNFSVFPNPTENNINVSFDAVATDESVLIIRDATGRIVLTYSINPIIGFNAVDIDIREFKKGVYFVELSNKNEVLQTKFIKK